MNNIDLNQVNHFVLRKQHLTDDSKIDSIVQTVRDVGGLHATSPTTPYLSLFSRIRNFARDDLDEELYVKRNLGKIRCMRKTVYILPREMMPIAYSATSRLVELASERYTRYLGITQKEYEETSKLILGILKGKGMTAEEIKNALGTKLNVSAILNLMCDQGLLIRGIPKKSWKSNIHTYYPFQEYFPDIDLNGIDEAKARKFLVKQYLASFGPVTENDITWWTGLTKTEVREALNNIQGRIIQVKISNLRGDFIALDSDWNLLKNISFQGKRTVNLLPSLDPYLMGYKERERYLNPKHCNKVFDRSGNITSTILLDGRVVGVWDFAADTKPLVKIFLFEEVDGSVLGEIHSKARKIGKFMADEEVQVKECDSMIPLTRRTAGGVISPLKGS